MDVLIVGGTGLISTAITRQLLEREYNVTLFNRGKTDADIPSVETIHGDRTEYDEFEARLADTDGFDCIIDMVCFTPDDAESAVRAFEDVTDQVIFCSTVDVYHRPVDHVPVREDAQKLPNVSDYGRNKAACEDIFFDAHERDFFETTVVRPWSTYGEGGTILHTFGTETYYLDRLRQGKPIVVHGDGSGLWGPCHRDDVARAFVAAIGNESAYGEAYHVTSEETMPWQTYHRKVAHVLDAPEPEFISIPTDILITLAPDRTGMLRNHFQYSTVFDNSKAKADLGFEYTISWEEGALRTVEWLEEHDRIEDAADGAFEDEIIRRWRELTDSLEAVTQESS